MILPREQAVVYRANGRRYLSKRNAIMAIVLAKVRAKYKEDWAFDREDGECDPELREENQRLIKRFARLLTHYDRIGR